MTRRKVKDHPDLVRDSNGVINNCDRSGFNSYIANRKRLVDQTSKISKLENDVEELKSLVAELIKPKTRTKKDPS